MREEGRVRSRCCQAVHAGQHDGRAHGGATELTATGDFWRCAVRRQRLHDEGVSSLRVFVQISSALRGSGTTKGFLPRQTKGFLFLFILFWCGS